MELVEVEVGSSSSSRSGGVGKTGSEERARSESTDVASSSSGAWIGRGGEGSACERTPGAGEKASAAVQNEKSGRYCQWNL